MACGVTNKWTPEEFVKKHTDYNFSIFINRTVLLRSYDFDHDPIFLIYLSDNDETGYDGQFSIILDHRTKNVKEIRNIYGGNMNGWVDDSLNLSHLVKEFDRLHVTYLSVDSNRNVFVSTGEGPIDIVHFSNDKFITHGYLNEWYPLGNNWFKRN
jgi:hypothetical protein